MSNNPLGSLGNVLGSLFGQNEPHRQQDYQQFSQQYDRYTNPQDPTNDTHFNPQDVQDRYRYMLRNAPPEVVDQAHQQMMQQLSPDQRQQLATQMYQSMPQQNMQQQFDPRQLVQNPQMMGQMMRQTEQQNPGILDQVFGGAQGALGNPLVKMALAGVAAYAAKNVLGGNMGGGNTQGGGGFGGTQV
ncbi:MAG: hypothetical protein NVSMB42_06200 [Herpetosiphon sp.]